MKIIQGNVLTPKEISYSVKHYKEVLSRMQFKKLRQLNNPMTVHFFLMRLAWIYGRILRIKSARIQYEETN